MSVSMAIDAMIDMVPDGCVPVGITLGAEMTTDLVESVETRVTLKGDTVDLSRAYKRDYWPWLVWHETVTGSGWELGRDVLIHMRDLKRAVGISHYRGIPITVDTERPGSVTVSWEPMAEMLAR